MRVAHPTAQRVFSFFHGGQPMTTIMFNTYVRAKSWPRKTPVTYVVKDDPATILAVNGGSRQASGIADRHRPIPLLQRMSDRLGSTKLLHLFSFTILEPVQSSAVSLKGKCHWPHG